MTCKDFKNLSLNQLRGKWGKAIIALFVATLVVMAVSIVVNFPAQMTANLISMGSNVSAGTFIFVTSYSLIGTIVLLFVSGCMTYGMSKYLLNLSLIHI